MLPHSAKPGEEQSFAGETSKSLGGKVGNPGQWELWLPRIGLGVVSLAKSAPTVHTWSAVHDTKHPTITNRTTGLLVRTPPPLVSKIDDLELEN